MNKTFLRILLTLNFALLLLVSSCNCKKDNNIKQTPPVDTTDTIGHTLPPVTPKQIVFTTDGGGQEITITSFDKWVIDDPAQSSDGLCELSVRKGNRGDKTVVVLKKHDSPRMCRTLTLNVYQDTLNSPIKEQIKIVVTGKKEAYFNMNPNHKEYFSHGIPRRANLNPKYPLLICEIATNIDSCMVEFGDPSWISSSSWNCMAESFNSQEHFIRFSATVHPNNTGKARTNVAYFRFKTLAGRDSTVSILITQLGPSDADIAEALMKTSSADDDFDNLIFNKPLNQWSDVEVNQQGNIEYIYVKMGGAIDNHKFRLLEQLKDLKRLKINGSSTVDTVGTVLYDIDNLEELILHGYNFKGITGRGLAGMKGLRTFCLEMFLNPDKTALAEFAQLKQIKRMIMTNNRFKGEIPPEIYDMTRLEELDLSGNELEGTVSQTISGMTSLKKLNLEQNKFTGLLPPYIIMKLFDPAVRDNWKVGNQKGPGFENIPAL